MKKANYFNFIIIAIIFILFYIVDYVLSQNNIGIYLPLEVDNSLKIVLVGIFFLIFLIPSALYASRQVFNLYIKHIRKTNIKKARYFLFVASLLMSYIFLTFNVESYYYFGSVIIVYFIYYISLFLYDNAYVKKSQETLVEVNDEVVTRFLTLLGGKDNIISLTYEQSRLKVELKDIRAVKMEILKELGAKGAFIAGNRLQAVVGNTAYRLESAIKSYLSDVK